MFPLSMNIHIYYVNAVCVRLCENYAPNKVWLIGQKTETHTKVLKCII